MSGAAAAWVVDPVTQVELRVPSYGTADEAIWRAAQKRAGTFRTIQLSPDYCRDYPLWESGSDHYTVSATDLGLSEPLALALSTWQQLWEAERLWDSGWSSNERRLSWKHEGDLLCERLREELWLVADVEARYRDQ